MASKHSPYVSRRREEVMGQPHTILRWFESSHYRNARAKECAEQYESMAKTLDAELQNGPEKSTALRKLLESKDAAVRQIILDGE